jgi:hypothetical protein
MQQLSLINPWLFSYENNKSSRNQTVLKVWANLWESVLSKDCNGAVVVAWLSVGNDWNGMKFHRVSKVIDFVEEPKDVITGRWSAVMWHVSHFLFIVYNLILINRSSLDKTITADQPYPYHSKATFTRKSVDHSPQHIAIACHTRWSSVHKRVTD